MLLAVLGNGRRVASNPLVMSGELLDVLTSLHLLTAISWVLPQRPNTLFENVQIRWVWHRRNPSKMAITHLKVFYSAEFHNFMLSSYDACDLTPGCRRRYQKTNRCSNHAATWQADLRSVNDDQRSLLNTNQTSLHDNY